jgi:hypothetical protein
MTSSPRPSASRTRASMRRGRERVVVVLAKARGPITPGSGFGQDERGRHCERKRSNPESWDDFGSFGRLTLVPMTVPGHPLSFSRRVSPELCIFLHPPKTRAQGRPGDRCTRGLAPEKLREGRVTTGTGGDTPAFPARWFTAYTCSPVNHSVCHRHLALILRKTWRQTSGRQDHDFAVRIACRSSTGTSASTAPRLTFVTFAIAPPQARRDAARIADFRKIASGMFFQSILKRLAYLILLTKSQFARTKKRNHAGVS